MRRPGGITTSLSQGPVPRGIEVVDGLHVTHENAHGVLGGLVGVTGDYAKCESVSGLVGTLLNTGGQGLRWITAESNMSSAL